MPLSPKTEQMMGMQQPQADQEEQIFEQSFAEMAQSMLTTKFPELAGNVVTFKQINSDLDTGSATGAFIIQRPSGMLYVPAILVENQLKPMEVMYVQEHDVFLPLSKEWLEKVDANEVGGLGDAVKTPETLYSDVDIRNLIVPPTTGRYSFASAKDLKLPAALDAAPNGAKKKFASLLASNVHLLQKAAAVYGYDALKASLTLRAEKTAAEEGPKTETEALMFATRATPAKAISKMFGEHAPAAMRGIAVKGYYAKDARPNTKRPVDEESIARVTEAGTSGAFKLVKRDGDVVKAVVIVRPHDFNQDFKYDRYSGPSETEKNKRKVIPQQRASYTEPSGKDYHYAVITETGKFYRLDKAPYGVQIPLGELGDKLKGVLVDTKTATNPSTGKGVFIRAVGGKVEGTTPITVNSVATDSKGVKRISATASWHEFNIFRDSTSPHSRIVLPKDENVACVPVSYNWLPVEEDYDFNPFVRDPNALAKYYFGVLKDEGAENLSVKKTAGLDDYSLGGTGFTGNRVETLFKIASDYQVKVSDAETLMSHVDEHGSARVLLCPLPALQKLAGVYAKFAADEGGEKKKEKAPVRKTTKIEEPVADPSAGGAAPPGASGGDPGMDPAMEEQMAAEEAAAAGQDPAAMDPAAMGQDPAAMGQAATPSPTDQAVAELQEEVTRAHEEHMKLLQHKIDALQMVAQRTQEITQGVPKEQSQAIQQAVSTAAAGAPQAGAPSPEGVQGAPQDPNADPGMEDPAAMQDPNAPMDPAMMDQAAGMADPEMFDAAALGTLAEHSPIKELVSNYVPSIEKSIDHIGRILVSMWMKGSELRQQMGEENYTNLEDRLRSMFRGLGEVVLKLNANASVLGESNEVDGADFNA